MSQTRPTNPFRPGSGIFPPLLSGREPETAMVEVFRLQRILGHSPRSTQITRR
ncbi:MAG: hypothetical protein M0Z49_17045 [Chloroflexi bacterium]|nr:hypothetical protein [Chloroflexota bacterium]